MHTWIRCLALVCLTMLVTLIMVQPGQNALQVALADEPQSSVGGAVAATSSREAVDAGVGALKDGGSAVDAALATALTQVALSAGSYASYAGVLTMVYYEAKTRCVYYLNA